MPTGIVLATKVSSPGDSASMPVHHHLIASNAFSILLAIIAKWKFCCGAIALPLPLSMLCPDRSMRSLCGSWNPSPLVGMYTAGFVPSATDLASRGGPGCGRICVFGALLPGIGVLDLPLEGNESRSGEDVDLLPLGMAVGMGGGLATSAGATTVDDDFDDDFNVDEMPLPEFEVMTRELPENAETLCSICHSEMTEPVALAGCGHCFCRPCISNWVNSGEGATNKCPVCRALILIQV